MVRKTIYLTLITGLILNLMAMPYKGTLTGKITDAENKTPLPGVSVVIKGTVLGATTDINGEYKIENLKAGSYVVSYSFIGFKTITQTDVIIRSDKTTYLDVQLYTSTVEMKAVEIKGGYFTNTEAKPLSAVEFSSEEIRRAPGTAGDVSRILFSLPSVAKLNDGKNSLMVRGGSPIENAFYLDNIEIPNINHFPLAGSTDGLMGILNVDFVKDITFNSGGFSPVYGDKLSSVMDISYREGDKKQFNGQINLSYNGLSGQVEGPVSEKGSFFFAANKSYLDLIMKSFANNYPAPNYYDLQGKISYQVNEHNRLSLLSVYADDVYDYGHDKAVSSELNQYGRQNSISNTTGINWLAIWSGKGYSTTSFSNSYIKNDVKLLETKTQQDYLKNTSVENELRLRNINYFNFNNYNKLELGIEVKYGINEFRYTFGKTLNRYNDSINNSAVNNNLRTLKGSTFAVYHAKLTDKLTVSPGARIDYFDYNKKTLFAPRILATYQLDDITSLNASYGIFYQNLPSLILAQSDMFKNLKTPKAEHYVLGFSRLLTENTRLTIELYRKNYSYFPIDPETPKDFLFDEVVTNGIFTGHNSLVDNGKAHSTGIEIMVQKKLAEDIYGMASASYSRSRYSDLNGTWRDRIYDNRFNFAVEGGYKPNDEWEYSLRWVYAGGAPYTPFDVQKSWQEDKAIVDQNRINGSRLPDYHALNLRVDKRFFYEKTNLVLYLSIWNVYNRSNVSAYTWNEVKNKLAKDIGWNTTPVFGVKYEF